MVGFRFGRCHDKSFIFNGLAERVGFEPTIPFQVCPLSRRVVSTTHAPLRIKMSSNLLVPHSLLSEEISHEAATLLGQNTRPDFHLMIQLRMVHHLQH
jgi:hypothetical protein